MYCKIDIEDSDHLIKLIEWLIAEVRSSSGDGDGIWYSAFYDIADIEELIKARVDIGYWKMTRSGSNLILDDNQECLAITNDKDCFDNRPSWQQVSIAY